MLFRSGVIRRHPDIKLLRKIKDISQVTKTQTRILENLWSLLKPGGQMVYATCSILKDENEKRDGINLSFDIELYFKDEINNNFDDIEKTINYIEVIDLVKRINSSANFDLIETLCNRILSEIMELYSPLKSTVRVRKYKLPIDTKLNCVEVEMTKENNV